MRNLLGSLLFADIDLPDELVMKRLRLANVLILVLVLLAACGSQPSAIEENAVAPGDDVASLNSDNALSVEILDAKRAVQPGSEEVFDFKVVNTSDQAMPVVVVLEHADGQRWRTALCVELQCLLGDGREPSVTDPVVLPSYLEQAFEAHVFVDETARPGQETMLTLRVEPLIDAAIPRSATLSAQVSQP